MFENGGPTVCGCGCKRWYNKQRYHHRLDGPAFEINPSCKHPHHIEDYYIHGQHFTKEVWEKRVEKMGQEALKEIGDMLIECYAKRIVHVEHSVGNDAPYVDPLYTAWKSLGGEWDDQYKVYGKICYLFDQARMTASSRKGN